MKIPEIEALSDNVLPEVLKQVDTDNEQMFILDEEAQIFIPLNMEMYNERGIIPVDGYDSTYIVDINDASINSSGIRTENKNCCEVAGLTNVTELMAESKEKVTDPEVFHTDFIKNLVSNSGTIESITTVEGEVVFNNLVKSNVEPEAKVLDLSSKDRIKGITLNTVDINDKVEKEHCIVDSNFNNGTKLINEPQRHDTALDLTHGNFRSTIEKCDENKHKEVTAEIKETQKSTEIPLPFQSALFWPNDSNKPKKKTSEKPSSVLTSQEWQLHQFNIQEEKIKKAKEAVKKAT